MAYVQLDGNGAIIGIFGSAQVAPAAPGYAVIPDSDPRIAAFLNPPAKPVPPSPRAWLERLAPATQLAIVTAAQSTPALQLWLLKAAGNPSIDVTVPETIAGVAALVTAGVITTADQTALLAP